MSSLPYSLRFENRDGYLYAHVQAEMISEKTVLGYISDVSEKVVETGYDRVMIVREIPGTLPDAVVFNISKQTAQRFRGIRVALVNRYEPFHDSLRFSMNVAANRGGTNELFLDEQSAEDWLLK